ncbi:hypothetical protein GR268_47685, partial [Rhizobium leguminosarum]|nr:hypothetical protein [Rhizobium leguminosarum]
AGGLVVLDHSGDELVFREEGLHRLDVVDPDDGPEQFVEQVVVDVVEPKDVEGSQSCVSIVDQRASHTPMQET